MSDIGEPIREWEVVPEPEPAKEEPREIPTEPKPKRETTPVPEREEELTPVE